MSNYFIERSPDYLEHHGILGMKWGVWNSETRARRLGEKRPPKEKKELTPEEIEAKRIKKEEFKKKAIAGLKTLGKATYEIARTAAMIYMAKQLTTIMAGQVLNTSMQLSKITATNQLLNNGYAIMNDPSFQNTLNTTMTVVDKGYQIANSPNVGAVLAAANDPALRTVGNNLATAITTAGTDFNETGANIYNMGLSYEQWLKMQGGV
jgi:hypothetical protein